MKIRRIIVSTVAVASLALAPAAVYAQDGVVTVDGTTDTSTTAGVPNTGVAPENKMFKGSTVFVGGSLLGAALGLGLVTVRKKRDNL